MSLFRMYKWTQKEVDETDLDLLMDMIIIDDITNNQATETYIDDIL